MSRVDGRQELQEASCVRKVIRLAGIAYHKVFLGIKTAHLLGVYCCSVTTLQYNCVG